MADRYLVERFDPTRLRAVRLERGLTQEQLGEQLGQTRQAVVAYENGRHTPRGSTLHAMARLLDVDVTELLQPGPVDLPVLRFRRNLSQTAAAAALGVSQAWYQRVEARRARIDHAFLHRLARVLQVDEDTVAKLVLVRDADA